MLTTTEQDYRKRILRVLVYIQNHLDEALPLEDLARVAYFSPYHFHRVFRGMVGESVKEHVRRLRLERAALRLKNGDQAVTRIALDAGYETHESFTRAFSAMFGRPPSRFRASRRAVRLRAAPSGVHFVPGGNVTSFRPTQTVGDRPMDVRIETFAPRRVAFVRHIGPYRQVGRAWEKLAAWAGPRGLFGPGTLAIGVGHDDPDVTPSDKLRYDACITVDGSFTPEGEVGLQEVGGGEYATFTHRGPYENVSQTLARFCGEWLPASGRELRSAPCLSLFRNSPEATPPEDLLTDIYMPLE
ncbi:MAG TPA: AraC family transcriptional regulator [Isosphaeraceae bacterium]|nr:AraC family transcriptional regulator [Isosphaeraceae bacterium]